MRKLIVQEWLSLDGYVADKNGKLDFFTAISGEANKYAEESQLQFMDDIYTIILGRNTYNLFVEFWPTATTDIEIIADKLNSTKKLVFSGTLESAPWGKWPEAEIVSGDAEDTIRKLKTQEGKNMVIWGSISLVQSLMKQRLIDEYHLHICPTILGGGRPLFPKDSHYTNMHLIATKQYDTGMVFLQYKLK